jgi:hypothetical protein
LNYGILGINRIAEGKVSHRGLQSVEEVGEICGRGVEAFLANSENSVIPSNSLNVE